jgi:hypothetical protein
MFKVEVTYGSDPIAQAALNRHVHDRLIEEVFNGRDLTYVVGPVRFELVSCRLLMKARRRSSALS